jgi:hypothetical protein
METPKLSESIEVCKEALEKVRAFSNLSLRLNRRKDPIKITLLIIFLITAFSALWWDDILGSMILIWIGIILTWFLTLQHIKSVINKERKKLKSQIKNKVNMFHFNNIKSKVEELRKPGITTQIKPEEYLDYDHLAKIALKNLALS